MSQNNQAELVVSSQAALLEAIKVIHLLTGVDEKTLLVRLAASGVKEVSQMTVAKKTDLMRAVLAVVQQQQQAVLVAQQQNSLREQQVGLGTLSDSLENISRPTSPNNGGNSGAFY